MSYDAVKVNGYYYTGDFIGMSIESLLPAKDIDLGIPKIDSCVGSRKM